jgi:hypothetical protein
LSDVLRETVASTTVLVDAKESKDENQRIALLMLQEPMSCAAYAA